MKLGVILIVAFVVNCKTEPRKFLVETADSEEITRKVEIEDNEMKFEEEEIENTEKSTTISLKNEDTKNIAEKLWRDDGRCGPNYPLTNGDDGQCDPKGNGVTAPWGPCCSWIGWCGNTDAHCKCATCVDYSHSKVHRRALIIGIDGLDGDEMHTADTPALNRLQAEGLWTRDARTQLTGQTMSGPGWTSILTGVEVEDHKVTQNGGYGDRNRDYPTMMYKLKEAGYHTAAAIMWTPIFDILEDGCCDATKGGNDQEVTDWVVDRLGQETANDDVIFVHLGNVDSAGHAVGFNAEKTQYVEAIEAADHNIFEMIDAILEGPNIANEEWLIIVTSDHGGDKSGGHGPMELDYRQIPLIISGPTITKGLIPQGSGNHMDTHPTTLDFFGLEPYPDGMDGRSWISEK